MPSYNVLKKGFMFGRIYDPDGKRKVLVSDKPLKPVPTWLEPLEQTTPARRTAEDAAAKKKAPTKSVTKQKRSKKVSPPSKSLPTTPSESKTK